MSLRFKCILHCILVFTKGVSELDIVCIFYFRYLAPEYLTHGIVDEKTDVFALGVLLLELVTGRRALDYSKQSLVLWVSLAILSLSFYVLEQRKPFPHFVHGSFCFCVPRLNH